MTDTPTPVPKPTVLTGTSVKSTNRNWSTKTLARYLAAYVTENKVGGDKTVTELFESLKQSIVTEEVGTSLDF